MYPPTKRGGQKPGGPRKPPAGTENVVLRGMERDLKRHLEELARADDRSLNKFILKVLRDYVAAADHGTTD